MAEFTSEVKAIAHDSQTIFEVLSDFSKLEKIKDKIPQDKISDFSFDKDYCAFSISPIGKIKFVVVEREANKTVKFAAEQVPFETNLWIQLKEKDAESTYMKLTVKADLNPFIKPMVSKPLQEALEKMANILSTLPYNEL
ncbi:MAG: polyketide cyclase [Bacteroidales bacterium 45-6]|nr:MAG: polyketide cyclase [Bacteroidales bacterium 45-6]